MPKKIKRLNNLVIVSDFHFGDSASMQPPGETVLDGGRIIKPSWLQLRIAGIWSEFADDWIPAVTQGEPFALVLNGDTIEGEHHGSKTPVTTNLSDQRKIAEQFLGHFCRQAARVYVIRGTRAHDGECAENVEDLAKTLGAKPDKDGRYSRYELWIDVGGALVHIMHHIGYTSSAHHETSAINAELSREISEAGRWGERPPLFVVRSHRHRFGRISLPAELEGKKHAEAVAFCTPGWQAMTPFAYRGAGRVSPPQFGGAVIRVGDEDVYARHFTRIIGRKEGVGVETI